MSRVMAGAALGKGRRGSFLDRYYDLPLILVFVAMVGTISFFHPAFLNRYSLISTGTEAAYFGTMALGMVFLLSMREIDLSVGSIFGLTIIVVAHLIETGVQPWVAAAVGVVVGPALGAVNGLITNALRIQTIIVTLGTLSIYRSFALIISKDMVLEHNLPIQDSYFQVLGGQWFGVPVSIWMFVVLAAILHVVYRYTRFGFDVRAIGSNPEAARLAGISIPRMRLTALMLQGLLCSVVGVVAFAYLEAGDPVTGTGFELSVIAAAIIGGTALSGGHGSVFGALIGALIIAVITTGLIQFGVTQDWALFATGAAIVGAVALDAFLKRRRLLAAEKLGVTAAAPPRASQATGADEDAPVTRDGVGTGNRP
ncbi:MAG TPA: ABC transporter permease [Candidatus Limnocylindrales bacterium]|nr:ABC transporter permease [Candidatus Limnocylindrales bacterium]